MFFEADSAESSGFVSSLFSSGNGILDSDLAWILRMKLQLPTTTPKSELKTRLLESDRVRTALVDLEPDCVGRVERIVEEMAADMRGFDMRVLGFVFRKVWRRLYDAVYVHQEGLEKIKQAQKRGPVVLLPTHRSHIDYLIMTYILVASGIQPPAVVAGDNLKIPVVGNILHNSGAVFIRREFGEDDLYKAVFHEYISCLLRDNSIIECFIEGGRSRSGKLLNPKFGFLKVLVDLLEEDLVGKRIPDITIFPVAISYDKVVEGTAYVREMMGSSKEKESLSGFISAVQALNKLKLSLGTIDIRFAEPFSLRDAMITGKYGPVNGVLHRKRFMMHLSHRVLHECNKISSVPATAVVAAVLLTTQHRGIHIRSLVSRVQWLCQELSERGARLSKVFQIKSMALAVEKSLAVLGKVTKRRNDIIFGFQEVHSLELSIYRNQMIHWFVSEALIAVALVRIITSKSPNQDPFSIKVPPKELLDSVRLVSRLLKFEFIYKPAPDIEDNFVETMQRMQKCSLLVAHQDGSLSIPSATPNLDNFTFLCMLIWPFIDVYWVTCLCITKLQPNLIQEVKKFLQMTSNKAEELYYQGEIQFYQAVSVEAISNALRFFISEKVISEKTPLGGSKSKSSMLLQIHEKYREFGGLASNNQTSLHSLIAYIDSFRKKTNSPVSDAWSNTSRNSSYPISCSRM